MVYDHGANEHQPPLFQVNVSFKDLGGKTEMAMTMSFETPEAASNAKVFIKGAGGNGTWDRLAEYLAKEVSAREIFVVNRSFEAPVEKVFAMWTNPKHLCRWLPPQDTVMEYFKDEIAAGRSTLFKMTFASGDFLHGIMDYKTIEKPRLIEYIQVFCDAEGQPAKHPFLPVFPERLLNTVIFTPEGEGQCRVTIRVEAAGEVTAEELKVFLELRPSMTQGWSYSFDKLEESLVPT